MESYVRAIFADKRGPADTDAAPSDTSGIHIDIHSFSELVLWPWGDKNSPAPNGAGLQTLGRKFAQFNGYRPQQSIGLYPTDGTTDSVSYSELGVAAYTFELGTSFFQSCSVYLNEILPDNLQALIYAAKVAGLPYITPSGPDITNISFENNAKSLSIPRGSSANLEVTASDDRFSKRNGIEPTQNIRAIEYTVNTPPWKESIVKFSMTPKDGAFNEVDESAVATISTDGLSSGRNTIYVRAQDESGTWGSVSAIFLDIE